LKDAGNTLIYTASFTLLIRSIRMIREFLLRELTLKEHARIQREDLEKMSVEINDTIDWCASSMETELCAKYISIVEELSTALGRFRLKKSLSYKLPLESIDREALSCALRIVPRYHELLLKGLTLTHSGVAIRIKRGLSVNGRVVAPGTVTFLNGLEAILLEYLGYAEIIDPLPLTY